MANAHEWVAYTLMETSSRHLAGVKWPICLRNWSSSQ